jgi:hypothetical protein
MQENVNLRNHLVESAPTFEPAHATAPARDRALDMARGYAIVAMITSHVGPATAVSMVPNFPHLLSAADYFFLVSGAATGLVAARKLTSVPPRSLDKQLLRRAARLYVIHCLLTLAVIAIHELTGRLRAPGIHELGGLAQTLWLIGSLQVQPFDYMNILPLFVAYFAMAPLVLKLLRHRKEWLLLAGSTLVWLASQWHPDVVPLPKPGIEPNTFSLTAWQFPFVVGFVLGYHRLRLLDWCAGIPVWLRRSLVALVALQFLLAQFQRAHLRSFHLAMPEAYQALLSKQTFAPLHALYAISFCVFGYAAFRWLVSRESLARGAWASLLRAFCAALETIGRNSLYCFVMHLPFALVASAAYASEWSRSAQNLFTLLAIAGVYLLARWQALVRLLRL